MRNLTTLFLTATLALSMATSTSFAKGKKRRKRPTSAADLSDARVQEINKALEDQASLNAINYSENPNELSSFKEDLSNLQDDINPKWDKYRGWLENPQWREDTISMSLAGEIYNEGWFGPNVSRQIVPDLINGWLVVDTVTIGPGLLMTAATLTGNILLNQVFPYIQAGPVKEKTFLNVRKVDTYEEAVKAAPYDLKKLPIQAQDFQFLKNEEQISTITTGGFFIRAGGGIANLIGLELPAHINIGPKSKFTYKGSLKLTVAKHKDDKAIISVERGNEFGNGIGFGFGIFFEDIIDIPVTIGVNSAHGYFPFVANYKEKRKFIRSIDYVLDLKTAAGREAYQAFLKRDFAFVEDIAALHPEAVTMDMAKEGEIKTTETNAMINLIVWRSGFRNIFVEGKFNTTDRAGNRFEYFELESEDIKDKKWFSNIEKTSMKYMALVPSNRHENGELILHKGGFVLDTHFFYTDTKTKGEEIIDISEFLMDSGSQMRLPIEVNPARNYNHVQIDVKVRIQADDMASFLTENEAGYWEAVAYAQGINDYLEYSTAQNRARIAKSDNKKRTKLLRKAKEVVKIIDEIKSEPTLKDRAAKMIKVLRKGDRGKLLHKTMMEHVGKQKAMVRGFVRGKYLN
jgi:hypothetical protein